MGFFIPFIYLMEARQLQNCAFFLTLVEYKQRFVRICNRNTANETWTGQKLHPRERSKASKEQMNEEVCRGLNGPHYFLTALNVGIFNQYLELVYSPDIHVASSFLQRARVRKTAHYMHCKSVKKSHETLK